MPIYRLAGRHNTALPVYNSGGSVINAMSIQVGNTVEGTIVKLADYGAIVRLTGGKTGLIHISEIADTFVRDVGEYFKEQDKVRVRILSINNKGRYELSIKNIEQVETKPSPVTREKRRRIARAPQVIYLGPDDSSCFAQRNETFDNFEDRLNQYLKDSTERLSDIKHNIDTKQGIRKR